MVCIRTLELTGDKLKNTLEKEARPYLIMVVSINNLTFGLPFRSRMNHKFGFRTIKQDGSQKGIDYTKAILIKSIPITSILLNKEEYSIVLKSEYKIQKSFEKFIFKYIKAYKTNDFNILQKDYKYSTLVNYHLELGID